MPRVGAVAERTAQIFAALAAFVFLVSGTVYLWMGCWSVTKFDMWRIYDYCFSHTWLECALHKHNGHPLFFPSFFWLADLHFFHGNQQLLFFAGLLLLFVTAALLLIPVLRDETLSLSAKAMATVAVIVGNFWMGRASITASGPFSCICSLVIASSLLAVLVLPEMRNNSTWSWWATAVVLCAGFVASFSFATGPAIWAALIFLGLCLRLPWRSFVPLGLAAVGTVAIYDRLPPPARHAGSFQIVNTLYGDFVIHLCRLAGSPFFYAISGWHEKPLPAEMAQSSILTLLCGVAGIGLAVAVMISAIVRGNLNKSRLKFIGTGLLTYNLLAMILVSFAATYFRNQAFEFAAPRYLFWSTLFWTGLLLIGIQRCEANEWLRWPMYLVTFAIAVLAFPQHFKSGVSARWEREADESAATGLITGVRDDQQVKTLFRDPGRIYRVANELRKRRLDMFANGFQDWIGLEEANLFGGAHRAEKLRGRCSVKAIVRCDNGATAARVVGVAINKDRYSPRTLVIVDPTGTVRGIARALRENRLVNRLFYLGRFQTTKFSGYICEYNPQLSYAIRSADDESLSDDKILLQAANTGGTSSNESKSPSQSLLLSGSF